MTRLRQAYRLKGLQQLCAVAILGITSGACIAAEKFPVPEARAEQAKNAVKAILKDPESAQFRNLYTKSYAGKPSPNDAVCGEVNAKNSYGGYIGFTRFYQVSPNDPAVLWEKEDWMNSSFGFICD
jgi:hypothetical protein